MKEVREEFERDGRRLTRGGLKKAGERRGRRLKEWNFRRKEKGG
jgi:hypothetical protein